MVDEVRRVQSVERAMTLLETIALAGGEARLSELAAQSGISKSTLHGILNTLTAMGYVSRRGTRYTLGLRLREVAQPLLDSDSELRQLFSPALSGLAELSGETCYLAVPCGTREYLYIDALEGTQSLRLTSPRGRREGLTTSAIGKIFLAHDPNLLRSLRKAEKVPASLDRELQEITHFGYALDLEQAEPGLNCLALPLRKAGQVVAAIGIAGPAQRLSKDRLHKLATAFMQQKFDITKL